MSNDDLATSYRLRAEVLRTLAYIDEERKSSVMLMRVAADYEEIAKSLKAVSDMLCRIPKRNN